MNYLLLVAVVAVGIYLYWSDKKNWELVYETSGHAMKEAQAMFSYLNRHGLKCRLKTSPARGFGGTGVFTHPSLLASVKIEVHKKDVERALNLLADYQQ